MKLIIYPQTEDWLALTKRPSFEKQDLESLVKLILNTVKTEKDRALFQFTEELDQVKIMQIIVSKTELDAASKQLPAELKSAIQLAKQNIEKFHRAQKEGIYRIETSKGIVCWRKSIGIEKVGLYIPGGTASLFSTLLMLGIPAKMAGCKEIVLCTPPDKNGDISPAILYTAKLIGLHKIFKVGGAQAIAAMAYGTESIPQVYKIFGPGNQFVTKAKELVQQDGIAIDMPAGPSEVLIIADESSNASFIAADLLSQAEHGPDSHTILLSNNKSIIEQTMKELEIQLIGLPRIEIAKKALSNSLFILFKDIDECIAFSNDYAPEHLILAVTDTLNYANKVINAGSVFLGNYSCESAGDYASGTNHTLPTNGYAKNNSGVSLDSFVKKISFQQLSKEGLKNIGSAIEIMAATEGLEGHKNAVSIRLKFLENV
jgi:histidinol dehydrogenase